MLVKKKKQLGQFFTKESCWLRPHVIEFVKSTGARIAYDPFAGSGDMLKAVSPFVDKEIGLDVDESLGWKFNDSLISIPRIEKSIIVTNPPYLSNYSAKRRGLYEKAEKYFQSTKYDDLYQLAIEKCLELQKGVMIVPETFITSSFSKNRLISITILEDNPFDDTENPVCVICFDNRIKSLDKIKIYKNDNLLGNLAFFERFRMQPKNSIPIKFNEINGRIALRGVDTTDPKKLISFMKKEELD